MSNPASIVKENERLLVAGDINFVTAAKLWEQSLPLLAKSQDLLFNFSRVSMTNSAALALLLEWVKYAARTKKSISFEQLPAQLESIAAVSGITSILKT